MPDDEYEHDGSSLWLETLIGNEVSTIGFTDWGEHFDDYDATDWADWMLGPDDRDIEYWEYHDPYDQGW